MAEPPKCAPRPAPGSASATNSLGATSGKAGGRAVARKVAVAPFVLLIRFYQVCISPLKPYPTCRFTPTCSQYALEAFRKYGPFKGFWLSLRRILRCRPGGGSGYDPVP